MPKQLAQMLCIKHASAAPRHDAAAKRVIALLDQARLCGTARQNAAGDGGPKTIIASTVARLPTPLFPPIHACRAGYPNTETVKSPRNRWFADSPLEGAGFSWSLSDKSRYLRRIRHSAAIG
jgi:hypothetical protein